MTGPSLSVDIAALNLQGVGDVVWDIQVDNGREPIGDVVWQRRIASSSFGDGAGSASYVGPCDADPTASTNTVKVWVVGLYNAAVTSAGSFNSGSTDGVGAVTGSAMEFENPTSVGTPLTQEVVCRENADVAVQFDVALMRPARQGFFDVAVNFDNIFCSAKFDCCDDSDGTAGCAADGSEDIELLFDADGKRATTMVLGFACTAGAGVETELYLDGLQLDCTSPAAETFVADITLNPSGAAGNQCTAGANGMTSCTSVVTESGGVDADVYLFQAGVYRGLEQLASGGVDAQKVYWNVALGVKRADTGDDITDCWLRAQGTAGDANGTGMVALGNIAPGAVYPFVQWDVNLGTCGSERLTFGDEAAMVRTAYTTTGGTGRGFAYGYGPNLSAGPFCLADGFHVFENDCDPDSLDCSGEIEHATAAAQVWEPENSVYGACQALSCSVGYHVSNGLCIQSCPEGEQLFYFTGGTQTFTVPEGCNQLDVDVYGGGGAGTTHVPDHGGYGGGGGGFARSRLSVSQGQEYPVVVGQGYPAAFNGGYGGTSSFGSGPLLSASGGQGTQYGGCGGSGSGGNLLNFTGGCGGSFVNFGWGGGGGGAAGPSGNGGNGATGSSGGAGGGGYAGAGGGFNGGGANYGGGGSGGQFQSNGGAGANGLVSIKYRLVTP